MTFVMRLDGAARVGADTDGASSSLAGWLNGSLGDSEGILRRRGGDGVTSSPESSISSILAVKAVSSTMVWTTLMSAMVGHPSYYLKSGSGMDGDAVGRWWSDSGHLCGGKSKI